jgi:phosphomannomutase
MLDASLFRKYDIRGRAAGEGASLVPEVAFRVGRAFGAMLAENGVARAIVGRDNRLHSPALAQAAVAGLRSVGTAVTDLGTVSTPLVNWAAVTADDGEAGAFMVTGSHLPPDQNGFKLGIGVRSLYGDAIQALYTAAAADTAAFGAETEHLGPLREDADAVARHRLDVAARIGPPARPLRVVVDAGSGTAGLIAPALIGALGHLLVECLYCEPDGAFPYHHPDPGEPKNLRDLAAAVVLHGADLGLAFDGDADRVGVVDERGRIIPPDRMLALLARDLLTRQPGATVVGDVGCSQVVFDQIREGGGHPIMWLTGHSLIKAKMREVGALLGGEISGHLFMGEGYYGFDDAYFAAARFLAFAAASSGPLSALDDAMPRYVATRTYRPHCPRPVAEQALAQVAADWTSSADVNTIDGLRLQFPEGWGGIRVSNTESVLSIRFEGRDEAAIRSLKARFAHSLGRFPEIDLTDLLAEA